MLKRFLLVFLVLGILFGGLFAFKRYQMEQMQAMLSAPQPPATISTTEVRRERRQPYLRAVGTLTASGGTEVGSEVEGIVDTIVFHSGQMVKEGDVLLRLDSTLDQATLAGLKAERRLAEIKLQRARDLIKRKAISQSDLDEARARYDAAAAQVTVQQVRISQKTVRAPFAGLLGIRKVDVGDYLPKGTSIVALNALAPIYVDYSVPEGQFARVRPGLAVEVEVAAYPGETFLGTLAAVESGVNTASRALLLRAELANADLRLRPGMFAEVRTLAEAPREVLTVPQTAISYNTYGDFVYRVVEQAGEGLKVERRQVTTGVVQAGRVELVSGVVEGDRLVRAGLVKLRDGQAVQIDNSVALDDATVPRQ